jgi:hypothetical protein
MDMAYSSIYKQLVLVFSMLLRVSWQTGPPLQNFLHFILKFCFILSFILLRDDYLYIYIYSGNANLSPFSTWP